MTGIVEPLPILTVSAVTAIFIMDSDLKQSTSVQTAVGLQSCDDSGAVLTD